MRTAETLQAATERGLREILASGLYKPGDGFLSMSGVVREFNVGDGTAGRALKTLQAEGYIAIEHGRTPYVLRIPSNDDPNGLGEAIRQIDELRAYLVELTKRPNFGSSDKD